MRDILDELLAIGKGPEPEVIAPDVKGMTSAKVRWILNTIAGALPPDEAYLEVGCWAGSTLISALMDNEAVKAYACDDWKGLPEQRRLTDWQSPAPLFYENLARYKGRIPDVSVFNGDFREMFASKWIGSKVGAYFYDADHGDQATMEGILLAKEVLAPSVIIVIDDWDYGKARRGAKNGVAALNPSKVRLVELSAEDGCYNGLGIYHLELGR
jgi:hypothetical protein